MTIDAVIMLLGACVMLLPFLGFPVSWDSALLVVVGALTIAMGIIVRRRGLRPVNNKPAFAESAPALEPEHAET